MISFNVVFDVCVIQIEKHHERAPLDFAGILRRGRQRREVLNKTLGSNTQHRNTHYGDTVHVSSSILGSATESEGDRAADGAPDGAVDGEE